MYTEFFASPMGDITVKADDSAVFEVSFGKNGTEHPGALTSEAIRQLEEYFSGTRKEFDLPLAPKGTEFQKKVWSAICTIGYGEVCTYKDIAEKIGVPKGCRAVGGANSKNPIVIIIPCHRVIAAGGKLGGYSEGIDKKITLLKLEERYRKV